MKIKGKVYVRYDEEDVNDRPYLMLKVVFKLPHQIFHRKIEMKLLDYFQDRFPSVESFYEVALLIVSDTEKLKSEGKEAILRYMKRKYRENNNEIKKQKLLNVIKELKKGIDIEVEEAN